MHSNKYTTLRVASTLMQAAVLAILALSRPVFAQTDVYNSIVPTLFYGHGAYGINNLNDGNAALGYGALPA